MQSYEYRVIPAPKRGQKGKGIGSATEDRFAFALQEAMNTLGAAGWDYLRCDILPCEERQGLTGRTTAYHNMLVFRRALPAAAQSLTPQALTPQALTPQALTPQALTPQALSPQALSPQALSPQALPALVPSQAIVAAPLIVTPLSSPVSPPALQLVNPVLTTLPPAPPLGPADRVAAE